MYAKYLTLNGLPYPDFDNTGNIGAYEAYDTTIFTGPQPAPLLVLNNVNSYSGGTVINCGTLVAQTTRFALSPAGPITINNGGELRLSVTGDTGLPSGNANGVGDERAILVNPGGKLTFTAAFNAGWRRPITIDGGTLHSSVGSANRNDNYANTLTFKNGALATGNPLQMGHHSDATITVTGTNASTIAAGLCLVNSNDKLTLNIADVTGDSAADLVISGVIQDYSDGNYNWMPAFKTGAGTLSFSAANTHKGAYTITDGSIRLEGNNALNADNDIVLNGGALEMGAVSNTAGTLGLTKNSELVLGSGAIAFKNSSALEWGGALTLSGTLIERSVRFGTDRSGLTAAQISAIQYSGTRSVRINSEGYLTVKPSGSTIMLQ